jgi:hypothetical protein
MGGGIGREDRGLGPHQRRGKEGAVISLREMLVLRAKVFACNELAHGASQACGVEQMNSHGGDRMKREIVLTSDDVTGSILGNTLGRCLPTGSFLSWC